MGAGPPGHRSPHVRERRQPEGVARFPRKIKEMSDLFIRLRTGRDQAGYAPGGHAQRPTEGVAAATGDGGGAAPVAGQTAWRPVRLAQGAYRGGKTFGCTAVLR